MEHNFEYRRSLRQERLLARRHAAKVRKIRLLTSVFTFLFLFISVIAANAVIANAGQEDDKAYHKEYVMVDVKKGDTVWSIAEEYMSPGYDSIQELIEEISFINSLDDDYSIKSGKHLMIPYYAEV